MKTINWKGKLEFFAILLAALIITLPFHTASVHAQDEPSSPPELILLEAHGTTAEGEFIPLDYQVEDNEIIGFRRTVDNVLIKVNAKIPGETVGPGNVKLDGADFDECEGPDAAGFYTCSITVTDPPRSLRTYTVSLVSLAGDSVQGTVSIYTDSDPPVINSFTIDATGATDYSINEANTEIILPNRDSTIKLNVNFEDPAFNDVCSGVNHIVVSKREEVTSEPIELLRENIRLAAWPFDCAARDIEIPYNALENADLVVTAVDKMGKESALVSQKSVKIIIDEDGPVITDFTKTNEDGSDLNDPIATFSSSQNEHKISFSAKITDSSSAVDPTITADLSGLNSELTAPVAGTCTEITDGYECSWTATIKQTQSVDDLSVTISAKDSVGNPTVTSASIGKVDFDGEGPRLEGLSTKHSSIHGPIVSYNSVISLDMNELPNKIDNVFDAKIDISELVSDQSLEINAAKCAEISGNVQCDFKLSKEFIGDRALIEGPHNIKIISGSDQYGNTGGLTSEGIQVYVDTKGPSFPDGYGDSKTGQTKGYIVDELIPRSKISYNPKVTFSSEDNLNDFIQLRIEPRDGLPAGTAEISGSTLTKQILQKNDNLFFTAHLKEKGTDSVYAIAFFKDIGGDVSPDQIIACSKLAVAGRPETAEPAPQIAQDKKERLSQLISGFKSGDTSSRLSELIEGAGPDQLVEETNEEESASNEEPPETIGQVIAPLITGAATDPITGEEIAPIEDVYADKTIEEHEFLCEFDPVTVGVSGGDMYSVEFIFLDDLGLETLDTEYHGFETIRNFDISLDLSESDPDYWTSTVQLYPARVSRFAANLNPVTVEADVILESEHNVEVLKIDEKPECFPMVEEGEDIQQHPFYFYIDGGAIDVYSTPGSNGATLIIPFKEDIDIEVDSIEFVCNLNIMSRVISKISEAGPNEYSVLQNPEVETVTMKIEFFDLALGKRDEIYRKAVEDADNSIKFHSKWLDAFKIALNIGEAFCSLLGVIQSAHVVVHTAYTITLGIRDALLASGVGWVGGAAFTSVVSGLSSTSNFLDVTKGSVIPYLYVGCQFVSCDRTIWGSWINGKLDFVDRLQGEGEFFTEVQTAGQEQIVVGDLYSRTRGKYTNFGTQSDGVFGINPIRGLADAGFKPEFIPTNPRSSLFLSVATGCLPGIVEGLERMRQIDCAYAYCVKKHVGSNDLDISECKRKKEYRYCEYVIGELSHLFWIKYFELLINSLKQVLKSPVAIGYWTTYAACRSSYFGAGNQANAWCITSNMLIFGTSLSRLYTDIKNIPDQFGNLGKTNDGWCDQYFALEDEEEAPTVAPSVLPPETPAETGGAA